jgi:type IV secretion system protein TrbC
MRDVSRGRLLSPAVAALLWLAAFLVFIVAHQTVAAGGGGGDMPWDPLLDSLVANIGGRTLRNILILAIIMAGIGFYFAEAGGWLRTAFALVIGFSIATAAATWGPAFFGATAASPRHPVPVRTLAWMDWAGVGLSLGIRMAFVMAVGWLLVDWWQDRKGHTLPASASEEG